MDTSKMFNQGDEILKARANEKEATGALKGFLKNLTLTVEALGLVNPLQKVYSLTKPLDNLSLFFTVFTIHTLGSLRYDQYLCSMMRKNAQTPVIDGPHFIVGLITVFKQFHPSYYKRYIYFLAHFVKNVIFMTTTARELPKQLPSDA